MPVIPEYKTPALDLRPSEQGIDALQQGARRIGAFYSQAGQDIAQVGARAGSALKDAGDAAVAQVEHHEINNGAKNYAALFDNLTTAWNQTSNKADPNDPAIAANFREKVLEPSLQKFGEQGFNTEGGQKWADAHVNALREHFFQKTTADMSTLAGVAAKINTAQTINTLSNTVFNDASALPFALKSLDSSVEGVVGSSPNIRDTAALRMEIGEKGREQIVKAAALGYIKTNGSMPPWVSDPQYSKYINGPELKKFEQAENYYKRLDESERRSARTEQKQQATDDLNGQLNDLERQMLPQKPGDRPQVPSDVYDKLRKLYVHPGAKFDRSAIETTVRKAEAIDTAASKPEPLTRVSHATSMDLLKRIRATDQSRLTDNQPIYDAYERGDLNRADFGFLVNEYNGLRTPEGAALEKDRGTFLKGYARLIDGAMNATGEHSMLGTQRAYDFEMDARRQEEVLRKQGKDPHLVYDPRSPDFFGRPENIAKYRVSLQEAQRYETTLKAMDVAKDKGSTNLTGPNKTITGVSVENAPLPKVGDRKQFRQGWGTWNGTTYVPEKAQ